MTQGLPVLRDENGDPRPENFPGEAYMEMAVSLMTAYAGNWGPDSIPGKLAYAEFEAFMRETQARAVEAFARQYDGSFPTSAHSWARDIRAGRTDLSGKRTSHD